WTHCVPRARFSSSSELVHGRSSAFTMPSRQAYTFAIKVIVVSSAAYLIAGALAYQLLTKRLYVGDAAIFAGFLRSEAEPSQWDHVMRWQVPILLARSALIALALT